MSTELRPILGNFSSITCFKSAILGMEDALGTKVMSLKDIASKIRSALGVEGSRLCIVEKITQEGDQITAYISEPLCSAGEL